MGDTNTGEQETPGDLRNQRDQLAKEKSDLAAQLASYQQREQLQQFGLGHLSARQQRSVLRELAEDGKDLSKEEALSIAEDLGYKTTPDTPTPTPTPTPTNANGDGGDGGNSGGEEHDDADDALSAFALMDRARRQAAGNAGNTDFEQEMRAAKSPEELTNLIRTKGGRHQIIHEWDVP